VADKTLIKFAKNKVFGRTEPFLTFGISEF